MGEFNRIIVGGINSLTSATDHDLLIKISKASEDKITAERAFNEFHRRYVPYLFKVCFVACQKLNDGYQLAKDLVQDTFIQVYLSASTYNPNAGSSVKAWLGAIARNKFIDMLHKRRDYKIKRTSGKADSGTTSSVTDAKIAKPPKYRMATDLKVSSQELEDALGELTDKKRHILMTHMLYLDPDNPNSQIPDKELQILCTTYKSNPDGIRQIKNRTLLELNKIFQQRLS